MTDETKNKANRVHIDLRLQQSKAARRACQRRVRRGNATTNLKNALKTLHMGEDAEEKKEPNETVRYNVKIPIAKEIYESCKKEARRQREKNNEGRANTYGTIARRIESRLTIQGVNVR